MSEDYNPSRLFEMMYVTIYGRPVPDSDLICYWVECTNICNHWEICPLKGRK